MRCDRQYDRYSNHITELIILEMELVLHYSGGNSLYIFHQIRSNHVKIPSSKTLKEFVVTDTVVPNESIANEADASDKKILVGFLLCFFLGCFGIHRFYVGKIGTGILQLLTLGGLGIWAFIDLIFLVTSNFKDKQGNKMTNW